MLRCLRRRSQACLLLDDSSLLDAGRRLWASAGSQAARRNPQLQWGPQACRRLTAAAAGPPQRADAPHNCGGPGEQHDGLISRRYEHMVSGGTLHRDQQQLEVAARLDALLTQLHGYRAAVASYRNGVQQYKVPW